MRIGIRSFCLSRRKRRRSAFYLGCCCLPQTHTHKKMTTISSANIFVCGFDFVSLCDTEINYPPNSSNFGLHIFGVLTEHNPRDGYFITTSLPGIFILLCFTRICGLWQNRTFAVDIEP